MEKNLVDFYLLSWYICMKMCRRSSTFPFLFIVTTSLLFLVSQTVSFPQSTLKPFIRPADIIEATGPFADKFVYVDKTEHFLRLFNKDAFGQTYFFARPRHFGKSTFLRTLQRILDGSQHIFDGTYIHGANHSWDSYPVLYMDFGQRVIETPETCEKLMKTPRSLTKLEKQVGEIFTEFKTIHELSKTKNTDLGDEFVSILKEIKSKKKFTVVLIDEYDFAVLNNVRHCPKAEEINKYLVRDIFVELKGHAHCIKFAFVTGISKTVFSLLGTAFNLRDISNALSSHNIAGLTDSDLDKHYSDHITNISGIIGKPKDTITSELKKWYNGYRFSAKAPSALYSPSSIHDYLDHGEAKAYWADKSHAQFVFWQMTSRRALFSSLNLKYGCKSTLAGALEWNCTDPALLLYDAGYITIHGSENGEYILKFPDREMEEAFYRDMEYAAWVSENSTENEIIEIGYSLKRAVPDFDNFMQAINIALKKLVIRAPFEEWYSWQTMLLMQRAGIPNVRTETPIKLGRKTKRVDITGENDDTYFLFECKFDRHGNSEAWGDIRLSLPAVLKKNRVKAKPLMLLAAGFTFSSDFSADVVAYYQAKLIFPNGTVSKIYDRNENPNRDTYFYDEKIYDHTYKPVSATRDRGTRTTGIYEEETTPDKMEKEPTKRTPRTETTGTNRKIHLRK